MGLVRNNFKFGFIMEYRVRMEEVSLVMRVIC